MSPARLGVTAQCPSHTFARARPPHAPCHPQSRADTVQNSPFPAAPRCSRTEAPPSRPAAGAGVSPSFPGSTDPSEPQVPLLPPAPLLTDCAGRGSREDAPRGLGTRRQRRDGTGTGTETGQESGADAAAARDNFLGAAQRGRGRARPPYLAGSTSSSRRPTRRPGPARRVLRAGRAPCAPFE